MPFQESDRKVLNQILSLVQSIQKQEVKIMASVQQVADAVAAETTVEQSVITLLDQIKAALDQAKTDPAALDAIIQQIDANKQALAEAVTRNTPA